MIPSSRLSTRVLFALVSLAAFAATVRTQNGVVDPALSPPNPKVVKNWAMLPDGRTWGSTAGVDIGPNGHVWAYDRCGANSCDGSNVAPILKFDKASGKVLASFGAGMFAFPHGLHVDRDGNVWVTDGQRSKDGTKGHQVFKFSPTGKVLLTLGKAGGAGTGADTFNEPNDVITAPNGDIFVSDGHSGQQDNPPPNTNARIVKFTKDGKYVKEWESSAQHQASSGRRTRSHSTAAAVCSWPIAAIIESRFSIRMESSSTRGSSSARHGS